ncbi:large subunit ribosomal protein L13e, partial [Phenoliferia sp. Uapishka_3]
MGFAAVQIRPQQQYGDKFDPHLPIHQLLTFLLRAVLHRNHFRKDWQSRVKTWFDQPGKKHSRRAARAAKATKQGLRPTELLRPAVRCPTVRYNTKLRAGKGFTKVELKAAGIRPKEALSIGIPVDHRRRNKSEEGLKLNKDRLEAYKARLVVFPKKAGKVKKGDTEVSYHCLTITLFLRVY